MKNSIRTKLDKIKHSEMWPFILLEVGVVVISALIANLGCIGTLTTTTSSFNYRAAGLEKLESALQICFVLDSH